MSRPPIFVADLLHALDALDVTSPACAREVMRMLSLDAWADVTAARTPVGETPVPAPSPVTLAPVAPPASGTVAPVAPGSAASMPTAPVPRPAVVTLLQTPAVAATQRPAWVSSVAPLPRAQPQAGPPPDPLFDPRQQRAVLAALAAAPVEDDAAIDLDRLVAILARGEPLRRLPSRRAWSLRRGVQVLIDQGAGMTPFAADVPPLLAQLGRLLPADRLQRATFDGSPLREVRLPGRKRAPWRPPVAGTSVLLVSDLGLGGGDERLHAVGPDDWLVLADAARRARVALRTLVPYPPVRWPSGLAGPLRCIAWDRRTTAATVRRALHGLDGGA